MVQFSCTQQNSQKTEEQIEPSKVKTVDDIDGSLDNVSYVANGGIITDTIYHDELKEKITIGHSKKIGNNVFISYSKYSLEEPIKYDMSFYYDGHFINTIQSDSLPVLTEELEDFNSFEFTNDPFEIGDACSYYDIVEFSELMILNGIDSGNYIHAKKSECPDWTNHIVFKDTQDGFQKLFELETTDEDVKFKLRNDYVLTTNYSQLYDGGDYYEYHFEYDLNNQIILVDTVYNSR